MLHNAGGAPISGAEVELAAKGAKAKAVTGADGHFRLAALPAGNTISPSRQTTKKSGLLSRSMLTPASAEVVLTLSARGEITVSELKQKGQTATGGEELSSQAVSELPLNKRDFSSLLLLAAGTMTDSNGATNFTAQFAINGQRGVEATFAMDGADISDPEMGGSTFSNFNVDAVEGIDSSSGWMPAEIGRGAAGFTNIRTRSGASGFHGSVFEFVRNSAFDARNYFDHATIAYPGRIPPFRRNEFGFTNGGPIYIPHLYDGRKRTFYFTEYQGFRQVLGTTQVMPVPTAADRPANGNSIVYDTVTYPDKSIDTLAVPVDPGIAAVLARYPMPNLPTGSYGANTYATASKVVTNADQFSLRIDHNFSPKDHFFARFTMDNLTGPTTNPDQTAIDPTFGVQYIDRQRNVVGHVHPHRLAAPDSGVDRSTSFAPRRDSPPPTTPTPPSNSTMDCLRVSTFQPDRSCRRTAICSRAAKPSSTPPGTMPSRPALKSRINRDTTYFGISPNGEYDFGGGTAFSTEAISSGSGTHNIAVGDPLPDTLSGFLSGSPFVYTVAIAPSFISNGSHIGPAAISRNDFNIWAQDTWKVTPRFTLDYGLRWELYTPITERAHRTGGFLTVDGTQEYVINPQPGYQTSKHGFGPRVQAAWQVTSKLTAHAGAGVTVIPPNIWQDNFLTGSTPFAIYPRRVSASSAPIDYGYKITPAQLPTTYTPAGVDVFASGRTNTVAPNTVMDVDRYEKDMANLTNSGAVSALNLSGIDRSFTNGTLFTWTAGLERKFGNLTADANYVGTAAEKLPRLGFPNAFPGAGPGFASHTQFDSAGNVIGGFGVENVIFADSHSTYHALQTSLSGTVGHGGPGVQASYTWSKSIDDTSVVLAGTGSTGAVTTGSSENPYDTHPDKGPSGFDVTHGFGLSLAQDLHLQDVDFLHPISRKATDGWELLSISSISSGSPFTVYSGIQQTGYGNNGTDRPDLIAKPTLSTARKDREDYFGEGANNAADFFSIPIHVPGGTGPNQGRFGTLGRNSFRGPAFYNFDFALIKDTPFGRRKSGAERVDLQFRAEFFNLFNIVTMGLPSNILNGSGFGEISKTAGNSRQIQFSLKLIY